MYCFDTDHYLNLYLAPVHTVYSTFMKPVFFSVNIHNNTNPPDPKIHKPSNPTLTINFHLAEPQMEIFDAISILLPG